MIIHCSRCSTDKEDSEFNDNTNRKNGKQNWCRDCTTEYNKQWHLDNRDYHLDYIGEKRQRKTHTCKNCGRSAPEVRFYQRTVNGRRYPYFLCSECAVEYHKKYPTSKEAKKRASEKGNAREKINRQNPQKRAKYIVIDSTDSDKRRGQETDIDIGFVESLISNPCAYCGSSSEKMTLDRIDNDLGHLKSNVMPCCVQCNYFRRNMPYDAWTLLIPGMKKARKKGFLDGWNLGTHRSNKKEVDPSAFEVLSSL